MTQQVVAQVSGRGAALRRTPARVVEQRTMHDRMLREIRGERRRRVTYIAPPRQGLSPLGFIVTVLVTAALVSAAIAAVKLIASLGLS